MALLTGGIALLLYCGRERLGVGLLRDGVRDLPGAGLPRRAPGRASRAGGPQAGPPGAVRHEAWPAHVEHVRGDIWELRITGRIHHRVLYVTVTGRRIVALHAFTKKRMRAPDREIETAERRLADWRERYGRATP
ncbi:MAG: type II toxin-antitoxin system RelE/ParE family toxin [Sphaerobacter sp.]|nr:type II toxin-antitoxin system RelE/ParE family toxin [Sphaerobacter sp.]